jgi:hypothetical protein
MKLSKTVLVLGGARDCECRLAAVLARLAEAMDITDKSFDRGSVGPNTIAALPAESPLRRTALARLALVFAVGRQIRIANDTPPSTAIISAYCTEHRGACCRTKVVRKGEEYSSTHTPNNNC